MSLWCKETTRRAQRLLFSICLSFPLRGLVIGEGIQTSDLSIWEQYIIELGTNQANIEQSAAAGAAETRRRLHSDAAVNVARWKCRWNVDHQPCPESAVVPVRPNWLVEYHLGRLQATRQSTNQTATSIYSLHGRRIIMKSAFSRVTHKIAGELHEVL